MLGKVRQAEVVVRTRPSQYMKLTHHLRMVCRQRTRKDRLSILHIPDGSFRVRSQALDELPDLIELAAQVARPAVDQHHQFQPVIGSAQRRPAGDAGILPIQFDAHILLRNVRSQLAMLGKNRHHGSSLTRCVHTLRKQRRRQQQHPRSHPNPCPDSFHANQPFPIATSRPRRRQ